MTKEKLPKNKFVTAAIILIIFMAVLIMSFAGYSLAYANKTYPRIYLASENFGGLSKNQAKANLSSKIDTLKSDKAILSYGGKNWEIYLKDIDFKYDVDKTIEDIWQIGRKASFQKSLKEQFLAVFLKNNIYIQTSYDQEKLLEKIQEIAKEVDIERQAISFTLKDDQIETIPSKPGQKVLVEETKKEFEKSLGSFQNNSPVIAIQVVPKVQEEQTEEAKTKFQKMVSGSLILKWNNARFKVEPKEIQKWAKFDEKEMDNNWQLVIELNEDKVKEYLKSITKDVEKEPVDAKLTISDGRVTVFQVHQNGYKLDQEDALKQINDILLSGSNSQREVSLTVKTVKPKVRTDTVNDLGIKELIGEGTTDFSGSPQNRKTNIAVGANMFNGVLIKPGDEFSFNQILGEVSAAKGFLPELVIKEDRLIPETGGGLCQVSTTMFRAAVNSGLDITNRTPHSFRVRYYEPPVGLDATVYIPKPDLKFKNDTTGHILIQTKIDGNKLAFQFYGTKDGRTVEIKGPYTSNYRSPGEPVYIDDPSMPSGEVKQIEKAVPGLTATVYWTVYRDGKVLHRQTFVSKYVAWTAKYKRGTGAPPPAPEAPPAEQPAQ